jgi:hypothetical protein
MRNILVIFLLFYSSISFALLVTDQDQQKFMNNFQQNFESYFHEKFISVQQVDSFMTERKYIYYHNLSTCTPGTYLYGYIDMFPIFATATVKGFSGNKCIVDEVQTIGVTMPLAGTNVKGITTINCEYAREDLPILNSRSNKMIKSIFDKSCKSTFN